MKDTPAHVAALQRALLMRRSGAERLRMGAAMFEAAKRLVRASLGDPEGRDHSPAMRARLFLRLYGRDFDATARDRMVAALFGDQDRSDRGAPNADQRLEGGDLGHRWSGSSTGRKSPPPR